MILSSCQEWNISVNKLSGMSGITQSTLNNVNTSKGHFPKRHLLDANAGNGLSMIS
jgi:hypothetical protein